MNSFLATSGPPSEHYTLGQLFTVNGDGGRTRYELLMCFTKYQEKGTECSFSPCLLSFALVRLVCDSSSAKLFRTNANERGQRKRGGEEIYTDGMAERGEQQESQQRKKAAAEAYDYEGDAKWIDYWSNVLIPDHRTSEPEVKKHFQLKYYKRYIDPELQVEPLSTSNKKVPSSSSSAERRRPVNPAPESSSQAQRGGTRSRAGPTQATSAANGLLRLDPQSIQFLANAWVLIMTILTMFPFIPRALGDRAYRFALVGTVLACAHSLYSQYGIPRSWNLHGIQTWLQGAVMGSDFLQLLYCIVFVSAPAPIKYAVIPVACRSLEQVAPYLKYNFSSTQLYRNLLAKPCSLVESNVTTLRGLSANSEVGLGFLLIVLMVTPQRNIVQALVYWQLLKLKYHAPTSSAYHRETWSKLGAQVNPLIQRFAPFLQTPLGYVQGWFLRAR